MGKVMLVAKGRKSVAVRLPKVMVEECGRREGDESERVKAEAKCPSLTVEKPRTHELLERLRHDSGTFPRNYKAAAFFTARISRAASN